MKKPMAEAAKMNKAEAAEPKSGHRTPAAHGKGPSSDAGSMSHANMAGAFSDAVAELHAQHPIPYHDHGPHHGTTHHIRHEPLHGMKPSRR